MSWRVEFRPEVEQDVLEAATWYEERQPGLGADFIEEIIRVWHEVLESDQTVVVAAVLHGARQDRHWQKRLSA